MRNPPTLIASGPPPGSEITRRFPSLRQGFGGQALFGLVVLLALLAGDALAANELPLAANPQSAIHNPQLKEEKVRELYVPFEDLNVLLEGGTQRVLLTRKQYEELLAKAKKTAEGRAPVEALLVSADYVVTGGQERAEIVGNLVVNVLEDGLHAVGLDVAGVGLRAARLDDKGAPIGLADDGRLMLFVQGKGQHKLALEMVAPLQTTAAWQTLNFRLPTPAATRLALTVPGDVEVKSGLPVVRRVFDEKAGQTRIELLPKRGDVSLVMSLNSRLKRKDRVVVARSVLVDEVTQAYERLHATVSLAVLHRAVDKFRFVVPAGFEVTDVVSPLLARWAIATEGNQRILEVQLREETTDTVVLTLSALRTAPNLEAWSFPHLEPLDVVGQVAVVGLVVEDRLKPEAITPESLIPIDTSVLAQALPPTVLAAEPGAARIRPVAAYYAPQAQFGLAARFVKPPVKLLATTNLLLILEDGGQQVRGGLALLPEEENLFAFDFTVPAGWDVSSVTGEKNEKVPFERYGAAGAAGRIHVRVPGGVPAGKPQKFYFQAAKTPKDWFGDWQTTAAEFPVFSVVGATRDIGAVAVDARDDMTVRPDVLDRLTPLDDNEMPKYGLSGVAATLAYRYEGGPYSARLVVERTQPRITAQTYSFFRVGRDALAAHYELIYDVTEARTRRVAFVLPKNTPMALSIRGLGDATVKEFSSESVGQGLDERRRWTAVLADSRKGAVRIAVDFELRLSDAEVKDLAMPVMQADGVAYQSGRVAVEGSAELDVEVTQHPRRVDIGELVDAEYQPGRRLLGAYGFVGEPPPVKVSVSQRPGYALPPAVVQRAELATVLSADQVAQTAARFLLRTKALFLEINLPPGSTLWAVTLDGKPAKPQKEGDRLLLSLPSGGEAAVRDLLVVYETPTRSLGFWSRMAMPAPKLALHARLGAAGQEVPVADLLWVLYLPTGCEIVRSEGTVVTQETAAPELAVAGLAGGLWYTSGGVDLGHGLLGLLAMGGASAYKMAARYDVTMAPATGERAGEEGEQLAEDLGRTGAARTVEKSAEMPPAGAKTSEPKSEAAPAAPAVVPEKPATPPPPPPPEKKPTKEETGKRKADSWALEGISSLRIDLQRTGRPVAFQSLGAEPTLDITVARTGRVDSLAWGLALAVFLIGLVLTTRTVARKAAYVVIVGLVATLLPVITGRIELAMIVNGAFYAACLLIPYYLVAGLVRWVVAKVRGWFAPSAGVRQAIGTGAMLLLAVAGALAAAAALAAAESAPPYVIQVVPPPAPVKVPEDAIILPYDPAAKTGIREVDRLLIPYDKYVALWNLAYPEKPIGTRPPPAPYALAGATFTATLKGDEYLLVEGAADLDVYTEGYAMVPLPLDGGVLARADLDGKPAKLSVVQAATPAPATPAPAAPSPLSNIAPAGGEPPGAKPPAPRSFVILYVTGQGRHRLELAVRMRLERRGGWRVAEGRLPAAPATALALKVPDAGTEVRLGGVADRRAYDALAAGETINTAVGADGAISIQWRPKVSEGQVDQTLTAVSTAALDIQEDQLRLQWALALEFRRGEREFFNVELPQGYLVEKVEGQNVRGWEVKAAGARQELEVTLLKRAKDTERFSVTLWRPGAVGGGAMGEFDAPVVGVTGAIRHSGRLVIRRSPLLDVRTVSTSGVTRTDLPIAAKTASGRPIGPPADESPLGIRPYQAYQFVAVPFSVRLAAAPVAGKTAAVVQTILRVAERERVLESRVLITAEDRPLYRARFAVPADLRLDRVQAPGVFDWALTDEAGRKVLTIYLTGGIEGQVPIVIQGKLGQDVPLMELALPHLEVLDVNRQEGDIVVQVDPAFDVRAEGLKNIQGDVPLQRVFGWLGEGQRALARLAMHYTAPGYEGRLVLALRKPIVTCFTVTNSRVTDRAVQDAVLIVWTIKNAGVREVSFLLPAWMKDARVSVPLLRQKTVTPVAAEPGSPVRVRLQLQDEVMDELRVLVENDRLLTGAVHEAPIPTVETGQTDRRYVALESAGRDEVVVEKSDGLEPLSRQQKEWAAVAGMLRGGMTQAYIVAAGAEKPSLTFKTQERAAVETARARIGLAQARLIMDPSGAYRAEQVYRIDNRMEQFLEIQLPEGAALWTTRVAGEPVKPTLVPEKAAERHVRIPLVKTAAGDLDYPVVITYGGRGPDLNSLRTSVNFPLIRTVKIQAELSQVELYLPKPYTWFWFRGTARRVTEQADFDVGLLAYENKQAERLVQTLRFDNPFAQARSMNNLRSVTQDIGRLQARASGYKANKALQDEAANAQVLVDTANREMAGQAKAGAIVLGDNNDFIRDAYAGQHNVRAKNQVTGVGSNWAQAGVPQAGPGAAVQGRFNRDWLASNSLENAAVLEGTKDQKKQRIVLGAEAAQGQQAPQVNQPFAPDVAQAEEMSQLQQQAGARGKPRGQTRAPQQQPQGGPEDIVQRYQQKVQQRVQQDQQVTAGHGVTVTGGGRGGQEVGGDATLDLFRREFGAVTPESVAAGAPAGMASLDVELPWDETRWTVYRFTTPREEVEIRASTASEPLIESLVRLAGVVGLVILALVVRRIARGRSFSPTAHSAISTALIILGILGMIFGVFPVAGLAAVIAGIVMKVRMRYARRKAAVAA